jgi:hypothetical protein
LSRHILHQNRGFANRRIQSRFFAFYSGSQTSKPVVTGYRWHGRNAPEKIKIRHIGNRMKADPAYGKGVAGALGIPPSDVPK